MPPMLTLTTSILALLATYRVAYLIALERGPFDALTAFRSWILRLCNLDEHHWLYDGMTCVRCLSWWLALPCVALALWGEWGGLLLIGWWGVAGGVLVLAQVLDAMTKARQAGKTP